MDGVGTKADDIALEIEEAIVSGAESSTLALHGSTEEAQFSEERV